MREYDSAFELRVTDLHWLKSISEEKDLYVQGSVFVQIGQEIVCSVNDGEWCVSAAALYLLRTLSDDHTADSRVGEHLIPCCGHAVYYLEDDDDVVIVGCYIGRDWEVRHEGDDVALSTASNRVVLPFSLWCEAVCAFADRVQNFYEISAPKAPEQEDAEGYRRFWREWNRRRNEWRTE